jgi:rod shape-determining protein MreD
VILSASGVVRVTLLVLLSVVLQLAAVSQFTILGVNPDLTPLIVLSVGLLAGPVAGSVVGFSLGLLVDMALVQTLGVTSLLLTSLGYAAGRYRELRDASHALLPAIAGFLATVAYMASFSVTQFLLGVDSSVSALVIRDIFVGAFVNAVIATPLFAAVRALLRPALVDSLGPRRRSTRIGLRPAA